MKNQVKSALAASLLAITATGVDAQERPRVNLNQSQVQRTQTPGITYTYAGARYLFQSLDSYNCDQDGINLYGSLDIQDGFFARASYTDVSGDGCGSSTFSAGGGYHTAYTSSIDMFATLSFESLSVDEGEGDSGIEITAGMRTYLQEQLEGNLSLFHSTTGITQTGIRGGLVYWFNEQFSATADLGFSADATTFAIGGRVAF